MASFSQCFLPHRYSENLELEDAVHTAILTLKESFEGAMTEDNIEIGICNHDGFRRLAPAEIKDYLASVQWSRIFSHHLHVLSDFSSFSMVSFIFE